VALRAESTSSPRAIAIVPARLGSTRLARKMLRAETGAPLVVHTARNVAAAGVFERVVVATDSDEILAAARAHDVEALTTSPDHPSGTDRAFEAWERITRDDAGFDVVVNVQGDEPELASADLIALVRAFADPAVELATLAAPVQGEAELESPDVVKVVTAANGDALYFSRAPIPSTSRARAGASEPAQRHVGVYAFRPAALAAFRALPVGRLEALENLEQLRWLEAGRPLRVVPASLAPPGIDTADDYAAFVARQNARREAHDRARSEPSPSARSTETR